MYQDIKLPSFNDIRNYETIASKAGTGINCSDLYGIWKFKYVWKNGKSDIDSISSSILQVLSANLELSQSKSKDDMSDLIIRNSIKFGIVSIVFVGSAFLRGKRPLLNFNFDCFYFKIGNLNLLKKKIQKIETMKAPFFSLIAIDRNKKWMCARGKGGGLAIWIKD